MGALTTDRNTPERDGKSFAFPVAAGAKIFGGSLIVLNGGYAEPGSTALGLKAVGRAEKPADNSAGTDGDETIEVRRGVFRFANDGSIDRTHIGGSAYVVDDQTVAATDGAGTRSAAGTIVDVEDAGVWIEF